MNLNSTLNYWMLLKKNVRQFCYSQHCVDNVYMYKFSTLVLMLRALSVYMLSSFANINVYIRIIFIADRPVLRFSQIQCTCNVAYFNYFHLQRLTLSNSVKHIWGRAMRRFLGRLTKFCKITSRHCLLSSVKIYYIMKSLFVQNHNTVIRQL